MTPPPQPPIFYVSKGHYLFVMIKQLLLIIIAYD